MNCAVFLDRDGTINEHVCGYVTSWSSFRFIPNALEALNRLACSDYRIIVVTNQSAVSRGLLSLEELEEIHQRMLAAVEDAGGRIDAVYACTHHPDDGCRCRKPLTGLIDLAEASFHLNLRGSWFVGDNTKDVETGRRAGCKTILVGTGLGGRDGLYDVKPDYYVRDILEAADVIVR